jgi:UPF0755 protein
MSNETKTLSNKRKIIIAVVLIILFVIAFVGMQFYKVYFAGNVTDKEKYLYVKTGLNMEGLFKELQNKGIVSDVGAFKKAALKMELYTNIKPGRYTLTRGMTNRTLINMIKAGNQEPVVLKFQNLRKKENFASYLSKQLEPDSMAFIKHLDSADIYKKYGFDDNTFYTMFIPNSYEMYWNTSPADFLARMNKEYTKFWTTERKDKAAALNLTPIQVTILASIVDGEALYDKEMPIIAGLYLNRLEKGIKLQADPTVIFANGDFTVNRVTYALLQVESKYNTYKYAGLPPGPIMMPSINAIDAVLNRNENDYIYMCAKEDFSGYHNFAKTRAEHEINANKYRKALNDRKIFR